MGLHLKSRQSLVLSQRFQKTLERRWDRRVLEEGAFTPHELKGKVSLEEVLRENRSLGEFSSSYLKQHVFTNVTESERERRLVERKKIVAVGFGRSYDSLWLREATLAGFETWWVDVSPVALGFARRVLRDQYSKIEAEFYLGEGYHPRFPRPVIVQGEIRSILEDPASISLDLETVEVWYFCRTLGCLSHRSLKPVLQRVGQNLHERVDPDKRNSIVVVSTLKEENPNRIGQANVPRSRRVILQNVRMGAERKVTTREEETTMYFDQRYTAMKVVAV